MDQSALHRRAERLATAWLATGCLVAVGVMVGVLGDAAAPLVSLAGLGGMITGIALHRPKPMSPWLGMAVAMLCFMAGGVLRVMCGTLGDMSSTRSILPDLATLPGYLLGALALARLVAVLLPDSDRLPAVIDSGAAAVAMFILAWVFVIEPLTHRPNVSATAVGLQLLYPVASVVMVSIAARLAFVTFSQNSRTLRLVFVSLCLSLLGDLLYLVADSGIAHVSSRWLDVPYLLAFTAFPAAMLHPDLAGVGSVRSSVRSISRRRAAFVTVAIAAPSLIVVVWTGHDTLDRWVLGPAVLLLLVLVAARMGHALGEASRHQARFAYLASHDELTGLPNRREIRRRLLDEGDAASMIAAVIDVDRFQLVNDTFDHDLGDALIRLVADRIAGLCGADWVVGHAGGAQYLAIGAASEGPALFERLEHLRVKLADRYEVNGSEFRVTASIGVASEGGSERARLLRDADTAMYQAKARGGDCVVAFDARMHERSVRRLRLEHDLRGAIERNELEVYYQPLVQLPDESIRGFEALVRWHHPVLGARLHTDRRGHRAHRTRRCVGARPRGPPARHVAPRAPGWESSAHVGERVATPVARPRVRAAGATEPRSPRRARVPTGTGGDRVAAHGEPDRSGCRAATTALGRRPDRDRRFRHRVLVARVPEPLQDRHRQDRPSVRVERRR